MKIVSLFVILLSFGTLFGAGEAGLDPVLALRYLEKNVQQLEKWTTVKAKKGSPLFKKKNTVAREVLDQMMDYDFIARYTIGEEWDKTPKGKQDQLFSRLKRLLTDFYLEEIFYNRGYEKKYVERGKEDLYVKGVRKSVFITTEVQVSYKKRPVIYEVIYHLHKPAGKNDFKVFDIELDGVSLIRNYKKQFSATLKKDGVDGLIKKLDKKLDSK